MSEMADENEQAPNQTETEQTQASEDSLLESAAIELKETFPSTDGDVIIGLLRSYGGDKDRVKAILGMQLTDLPHIKKPKGNGIWKTCFNKSILPLISFRKSMSSPRLSNGADAPFVSKSYQLNA